MDDTCAVCAETLEWVAYGSCGHCEVCSTCVSRLRCICDDRYCCICKSASKIIFVTKALGDYTRMISDFSVFPSEPREGRVGQYWYHEDTQEFFDDLDHYRMIKAMCKLSCSVCDKMDELSKDVPKMRNFRDIVQLKGHLFHQHNLFMCNLCLESRKIFILEQKLYTRAQLNQHVKSGDSEVDGSESERCGFNGHPLCEFCRKPYYGENELYLHMSTEHYTCHICQRQHPGQFQYYRNYDDLELHFRQEHFLCEDESCLAKKFVAFSNDSEMKRHNAKEHGGHMSRAMRNAALRIPTSFRYKRNNEQDRRRIISIHEYSTGDQLSLAIQASIDTASNANTSHDTSSSTPIVSNHGQQNVTNSLHAFESLSRIDSEPLEKSFPPLTEDCGPSKYCQVTGKNFPNMPLESSFPPLPTAPKKSKQKSKVNSEELGKSTLAARLRSSNIGTIKVLNSTHAWPAAPRQLTSSSSSVSSHSRTVSNPVIPSSSNIATSRNTSSINVCTQPKNLSRAGHSFSTPIPVDKKPFDPSVPDFPPVSVTVLNKSRVEAAKPLLKEVHVDNKSLVETIRAALEFDEDKYVAFKIVSGEYRQGVIGTAEYMAYVHQFGLSHLILDLARLCPDSHKRQELIEIHNLNSRVDWPRENHVYGLRVEKSSKGKAKCSDNGKSKDGCCSAKGKGKVLVQDEQIEVRDLILRCSDNGISDSNDALMNGMKNLQLNYRHPFEGEVEILSKDGYRSAKGKHEVLVQDEQIEVHDLISRIESDATKNMGNKRGNKKTSKFHRVRLGESSPAVIFNASDSNHSPSLAEEKREEITDVGSNELSDHGVWKNGGGQKLVSSTFRKSKK